MNSLQEYSLRSCLQSAEEETLANVFTGMSYDELDVLAKLIEKSSQDKQPRIVLRRNCTRDESQFFAQHVLGFLHQQGYTLDLTSVTQRIDPVVVLTCALLTDDDTYTFERVSCPSSNLHLRWASWNEEDSEEDALYRHYNNAWYEDLSRGNEYLFTVREKGVPHEIVPPPETFFTNLIAYAVENQLTLNTKAVADFPKTGPYRVSI